MALGPMSDTPVQAQFVWTCPKCGRRVPNRLNNCRCGYQRGSEDVGVADPTAAHPGPLAPPAPSAPKGGSMLAWVLLAVVALAAAGTLVALQLIPVTPQPRAPGAASLAPAPDAPLALPAPLAPSVQPGPFNFGDWQTPASPPLAATGSSTAGAPSLEDVVSNSVPAIVSIETREGKA